LPDEILKRYNIPGAYKNFLERIENRINKDENKWFLCINDYMKKGEGEFRWNEYEIISIEAREGDNTRGRIKLWIFGITIFQYL
jgi:hypothetical protein